MQSAHLNQVNTREFRKISQEPQLTNLVWGNSLMSDSESLSKKRKITEKKSTLLKVAEFSLVFTVQDV